MKAIFILFDSLNRHYLPPYGGTETYAPNFERLSQKAVTFENSYVSSMPCVPARRELHTGRKNFLHREWGPLEPFDDSMPELLKKSGVYSHLISDHLHYWEDGGSTYHNRYSSWEIVRGQEGDHWKGQKKDPHIPDVVRVPKNQQGTDTSSLWRYDWVNRQYIKREEDQPQTKVFNLGCEFINNNWKEDNWMLQIETFDPHEPFQVMDHYLNMYNEKDYDGKHYDWPRGKVEGETSEEIEQVRKVYQSLVTMCDHNLGKVLDLMDRYNMWEDTMLIVGTDHGFMLGEHQYWGKNQVPYYNEVANTPLFIYDPRLKVQNEKRSSIVQLIDWAPTLLDFFGLEIPEDMEGKPLRHVIEDDTPIRDAALFGVFSGHVNVTDGKHVYMRAALKDKTNDLFNYTLMPMHMHNLFTVSELSKAQFVEGFSFTKGLNVLKVPAKDKYKVNNFGNLLFDLEKDPKQLHTMEDKEIEEQMITKLLTLMEENEAPVEQYERIGLDTKHKK
ncbi:sulfatase-like hydrolase/transferase [Bacillus sp. SD088]|uniref:sulfatase-like hydrolase/transferase n=1 Tax=Bacillus sp. SD088 TaxID=2782012 RepID=UPI001A97271D|nr:sulfatase-like hydrolase/transferase [Bacillus sp. SD088]MBO0993153.1 sulfatase-like hydrolase/transferase [Bacillus sp. SD088]